MQKYKEKTLCGKIFSKRPLLFNENDYLCTSNIMITNLIILYGKSKTTGRMRSQLQ